MIDPTKRIHIISSSEHHKALEQLEALVMAAEAWLKPAHQAVPCQEEYIAFLRQIIHAKTFLLGKPPVK